MKTKFPLKNVMSEETRASISASVRAAAERKRAEEKERKANKPKIEVKTTKMSDQNFSKDLFVPMRMYSDVDEFFSTKNGIPKATNFLVVGDPGVGKSTVMMDMLSDLQASGFKTLFISAEMTPIDLFEYTVRFPKFNNLDIVFSGDYIDDDPIEMLEQALVPGYDVVLIDSFAELQDSIKCHSGFSSVVIEKKLIDIFLKHNKGENETAKNTTFLIIQQVTKGGKFVGSNKLKHSLTGMLEIRFDRENDGRYLEFSKNRRGEVNRRLYFSLIEGESVNYFPPPEDDKEEDNV